MLASVASVSDVFKPVDAGLTPDEELVFALLRALHQAGLPAHRLETTLEQVTARLGLKVQILALPTGLLICSERPHPTPPATLLMRLQARPVDLEQSTRMTRLAGDLASGRLAPGEALARIKAEAEPTPRWGRGARVSGFVLCAAAFSVFFGGGARELAVATAVGLAVGLVWLAFGTARIASRRFELVAAGVATFVAAAAEAPLGHYIHWIPLASGMVILLPGLSLVDAIEELAHGHLASGSARMAGVAVAFLALTFGILLGSRASDALFGYPTPEAPIPFPDWAILPALAVVTLGSTIRFQARPEDARWILLASCVALFGVRAGAHLGDPLMGPFVGALLLGLTANLYTRLREPTPQLLLVPGLALLVPGSIGLRSFDALLTGDSLAGIEQGSQMFLMATALVAGLLFSNPQTRAKAASTAIPTK